MARRLSSSFRAKPRSFRYKAAFSGPTFSRISRRDRTASHKDYVGQLIFESAAEDIAADFAEGETVALMQAADLVLEIEFDINQPDSIV